MYKTIELITKEFDKRGVHYEVKKEEMKGHIVESINAGFGIDCGPNLLVRFISQDDDNDVLIGIFGMLHVNILEEGKLLKVLQACNTVNREHNYLRFYVDHFGMVNMEYDIPVSVCDTCIGAVAFEIFWRIMNEMDNVYQTFLEELLHTVK